MTRRPADVPVHEWHHRLMDQRVSAWRSSPARSGIDRIRRREAAKRAYWTVRGHLQSHHGQRNAPLAPSSMTSSPPTPPSTRTSPQLPLDNGLTRVSMGSAEQDHRKPQEAAMQQTPMSATPQPHVHMRYRSAAAAIAGAGRLAAKYGPRFAVVADADGGDFCPFAVVSHPSTPDAIFGPKA